MALIEGGERHRRHGGLDSPAIVFIAAQCGYRKSGIENAQSVCGAGKNRRREAAEGHCVAAVMLVAARDAECAAADCGAEGGAVVPVVQIDTEAFLEAPVAEDLARRECGVAENEIVRERTCFDGQPAQRKGSRPDAAKLRAGAPCRECPSPLREGRRCRRRMTG